MLQNHSSAQQRQSARLLLLFVWTPAGVNFFPHSLGCTAVPPFGRRSQSVTMLEYCVYHFQPQALHPWRPSVASLRYIRISTYMLTLMTSEVARSLSRGKPRCFLHTHSLPFFQDTGRKMSYLTVLWHIEDILTRGGVKPQQKKGTDNSWVLRYAAETANKSLHRP